MKQSAAGGELHVTVAQGSGLQTPPLQPNGHTKSVCVEEQVPLEQTGELKVRRVEPMQVAAGAVQAKFCEV